MNRIAITNLGKYNEGILSFKWLELPCTKEELHETLQAIGVDGKEYEEFFISDFETEISGLRIGKYENEYEQIDLQNPLLREEGQRESQRLSPPDVPSYGRRRNQAVQLQAGRAPETLGRENGTCHGHERRGAENQCGG